jgi:hypothetical protein
MGTAVRRFKSGRGRAELGSGDTILDRPAKVSGQLLEASRFSPLFSIDVAFPYEKRILATSIEK